MKEIIIPQSRFRRDLNGIMKKMGKNQDTIYYITVKKEVKYTAVPHQYYHQIMEHIQKDK